MSPDRNDVIAQLRNTTRDLVALTTGATAKSLDRAPKAGEWSARQVVGHLADAEMVYGVRIRMVLTSDDPALSGYNEGAWAQRFGDLEEDVRETVSRWRTLRDANLRVLADLAAAEWDRAGNHSERGRETVADMARILAAHDREHLDQIRGALAG